MPNQPKLTFWWFLLKWYLLLIPLVGICLLLSLSDYPLLALLPLVVYSVFFARDVARFSRGIRGKIVRSDGSEAPRTLRNTIFLLILIVALGSLFFFYSLYVLLALLALVIVTNVLAPFAVRYGWFDEGSIAARLNRPRFVDDRFRGSVDPTR